MTLHKTSFPPLQVATFEEQHSTLIRSSLQINGGDTRVWTQTLVSFTGTRFLHSASVEQQGTIDGLSFPEEELEASLAVVAMMQVGLEATCAPLYCCQNGLHRLETP